MTPPKTPLELLEQAKSYAIWFLKEAGWQCLPKFTIETETSDLNTLGEYVENSQFNGLPQINIGLAAISNFIVTDHLETMICTIGHELGHMAHEAAQYDPEYPKFGEYFADEEDMCEWLGWALVMDDPVDLAEHPYFGLWISAVTSHYFYRD